MRMLLTPGCSSPYQYLTKLGQVCPWFSLRDYLSQKGRIVCWLWWIVMKGMSRCKNSYKEWL